MREHMKTRGKPPTLSVIPGLSSKQIEELGKAAADEARNSPRIAIIGQTGVGKTSTINAMFNAGLEISHVRACTQDSQEFEVPVSELNGSKGIIKIYDMPGLGEDLDADERHKVTYKRVLAICDVAVWVLDGVTRAYTPTQLALRDVVGAAMGDLDRLVIGINKIDLIQPGVWNEKYNLPSPEQEPSITEKIDDVLEKIGKVCSIPRSRIIPYSAMRWYRLADLLGAMLDACPKERAWVLYEIASLADFLAKVDPKVRQTL